MRMLVALIPLLSLACAVQIGPAQVALGQSQTESCEQRLETAYADGRVEVVCQGYHGTQGGALSEQAADAAGGVAAQVIPPILTP